MIISSVEFLQCHMPSIFYQPSLSIYHNLFITGYQYFVDLPTCLELLSCKCCKRKMLEFWPNVDQFWHQISKSWYIPKAYFSPEIFPRTYSNYVQNAKTCWYANRSWADGIWRFFYPSLKAFKTMQYCEIYKESFKMKLAPTKALKSLYYLCLRVFRLLGGHRNPPELAGMFHLPWCTEHRVMLG